MTRISPPAFALAALAMVPIGCGGASWPRSRAVGDSAFLQQRVEVTTVDVLPIDVQLWTHNDAALTAPAIAAGFDHGVMGELQAGLSRRGYQVAAAMDWSGSFVDSEGARRAALSPEETAATAYALSSFGTAQASSGRLLSPHLPVRLGESTGSDATLYVGGWAFAGEKQSSTGEKVAKGVAIGLLVVVAVVVIAAAIKSKGKSSGGGSGVHGTSRGVARGAAGAGRVAGRSVGVGRGATAVARGTLKTAHRVSVEAGKIALHSLDAFARSGTHIEIYAGRPDYYAEQTGHHSGPSRMLLEMTLVDNRTGHVLWHVRQEYPADPRRPQAIARAVDDALKGLPAGW